MRTLLLLQVRPGSDAKALIEERITVVDSPAEVAEKCDVLSIHLAASPLTKNIVNDSVIGKLKPGVTGLLEVHHVEPRPDPVGHPSPSEGDDR